MNKATLIQKIIAENPEKGYTAEGLDADHGYNDLQKLDKQLREEKAADQPPTPTGEVVAVRAKKYFGAGSDNINPGQEFDAPAEVVEAWVKSGLVEKV